MNTKAIMRLSLTSLTFVLAALCTVSCHNGGNVEAAEASHIILIGLDGKSDMKEAEFLDREILSKCYGNAGMHSIYVLEIVKLWK